MTGLADSAPGKRPKATTKRPPRRVAPTSVLKALDAELAALAKGDAVLARSAIAMGARVLAVRLDDGGTSATAAAACMGKLLEALAELRALGVAEDGVDAIDRLRAAAGRKMRVAK